MSNDMSMFKKMRERITDEVNSATNKLQNMQLMDQLSSSIGQQIATPNQLLPEPQQNSAPLFAKSSDNRQFSLMDDDGPICGFNEEDELNNSEFSPQHQLFNENSIKRINTSNEGSSNGTSSRTNNNLLPNSNDKENESADLKTVINIQELSSDIENSLDDDDDDGANVREDDIEIDLLSDKPIHGEHIKQHDHLLQYKSRYRSVVRSFRQMHLEFKSQQDELESQRRKLLDRIAALETELDNFKSQQNKYDSTLGAGSDTASTTTSPQPSYKSSSKVKDLERILAKCKESLKMKNSQIKSLKETLGEVEKFGEMNQELKRELSSLREAHETWTISIAENKRIMHQEIENKNNEMDKLRGEVKELQNKLVDSNNKIKQFKSAIQDLESRLVSTSAAHQKERESLTKELTLMKNNAIKQLQKDHELQIERVKLDLEKSIEALKQELLAKDELIMEHSQQYQQVTNENSTLNSKLDESTKKLQEQEILLEETKQRLNEEVQKSAELCAENEKLQMNNNSIQKVDEAEIEELKKELDASKEQLKAVLEVKEDLESQLKALKSAEPKECEKCDRLSKENQSNTELFQQEMHELNTRLELMTTANYDQEKEIESLKLESQSIKQNHNLLKSEFEELLKKNESLARVLRENEIDMQAHQEQLDNLVKIERELESMKKENASLLKDLSDAKAELSERNADLSQLKSKSEDLTNQLETIKIELENTQKVTSDLERERDSFSSMHESLVKQKREQDEKMVVKILSAIKNLETPITSPGSDKSFETCHKTEFEVEKRANELPDTVDLMEELLSIALDRNTAYLTTTQRLQTVLLENSLISEEVKRLKEELNNLHREKTLETQHSIEEAEKLRVENEALIQDQNAYDDKMAELEDEIRVLTKELKDKKTTNTSQDSNQESVPTSTEFEYLKNIVYQFMLGKEPLVLARVISAVFKFDKSQVDQICKVQEAIQSSARPTL